MYPGENIRIGLKVFDLNDNPTYGQILARLTTLGMRQFKKHFSVDITYTLCIEQQIQTITVVNARF